MIRGSFTLRLALGAFAAVAAAAIILLGAVYWSTAGLLDRQAAAAIDADGRALRAAYDAGGSVALARAVGARAAAQRGGPNAPGRTTGALYLLATPAGDPIAGNLSRWPDAAADRAWRDGRWLRFDVFAPPARAGDPPRRAAAQAAVFTLDGGLQLLVGRDLQEQAAFQRVIGAALLWAGLGAVAVAALGAVLVARVVRRRLGALRTAAAEIVSGDLKRRMPLTGVDDEFDRLAAVLNQMLDRLDGLMDGFRTIADDVAHDLRSPLSRLRARLEVALMGAGDAAAYRAALEETVADVEALLAIFNAVAKIAHLDAGGRAIEFASVDLAAIARDAGELYAPVLEDAGLSLTIDAAAAAPAQGDRALLGQALANLLDNAAAYAAPTGARVVVTAAPGLLSVADDGPGVPPEQRARATERRARLDASRSRAGAGLGLSLAAAAARAHGGALVLDDGLDGRGLTAQITLPATA